MNLEKALRWVVLAGIFLLPFIVLYVSKSLFFPFITGKNFAFRIIVEIITGGWVALALANPVYRPKRTWLLWAFAAFVLIIGIADAFGVYPHKSLWSNYERMDGWITIVHLFALFVVMQAMLNTEKLWKQWWHTSLGVSALVAVYGLFQLLGFITINQGGVRLDATFGNSTYLGVYMLFHVFIAALYLSRAWIESPQKRMPHALLYGSLMFADSFILFFTATRGAMIGLIGGALLSAIILILLAPRSRVAWRAGAAIGALVVVAGLFWAVHNQAWINGIEPLHRLAIIGAEGIPDARQMNWGMAWQGAKERPILGWGQENYAAVFDKYYNPSMYAQEPWFDRVHNIIFDWLIAGGILGLLAYLSIHASALLLIWKRGAFASHERAILTGLMAGYFFYLVFTFDNITSYLMFVALLAFLAVRASAGDAASSGEPLSARLVPFATAGVIALTWIVVWFANAHAIAQNRAIIRAIMPQQGGAAQNLELFKEAISYNSVGNQEAREQFSQAAVSVIGAQNIPTDLKQQFVQDAFAAMKDISNDAPKNARFPLFMGILLDQAGAYDDAHEALAKAHELSPAKQSILFEFGLNAFARGKTDEAVAIFKEAYDLAPEYHEAQMFYAAALVRAGKDAEADAFLKPHIEADDAIDARVASAYAGRGRYDKIVAIWSTHTAKHPEDLEARFVLAGAYYAAKNSAAALKELEAVKREYPSSADQADQLIQQVKSGVNP